MLTWSHVVANPYNDAREKKGGTEKRKTKTPPKIVGANPFFLSTNLTMRWMACSSPPPVRFQPSARHVKASYAGALLSIGKRPLARNAGGWGLMALPEPCHGSWGHDVLLPARGMRLVSGSTMGIQSVCHAPPAKRSLAHSLGVQARLILASGPCHGETINPYSESFAKPPFFFKSHSQRP